MAKKEPIDESALFPKYALDPAWILLVRATEKEKRIDYLDKDQGEFIVACEKILNCKITKGKKVSAQKAFRDCWTRLVVYKEELKKFDTQSAVEGFINRGEVYREPRKLQDVKKAALESYQELRIKLKACFNLEEIQLLRTKFDVPSNITASIFSYLITGSLRVDSMPKAFLVSVEEGSPKVLLTANATRDDLDECLKSIQGGNNLPLLKNKAEMDPYFYKYIDGLKYVAINVYKDLVSNIRMHMLTINRLQSELPGYSWKSKRKKINLGRDLEIKKQREESGTPYDNISEILSNKYKIDENPSAFDKSLDSTEPATLRKAYQRIKSK